MKKFMKILHDPMIRVNLIMDHGMGNFGSYGYDPGSCGPMISLGSVIRDHC